MEITIAPDGGVTFRVLSDKAVPTESAQSAGAKEWEEAIAKLEASPKGGKGR